jgi:hypothetical protein
MTRTARPVSSASNRVCGVPSDSPTLGPEVGVLGAEGLGLREGRVG